MIKTAYHATRSKSSLDGILKDKEVRPLRLPHVYLFSDEAAALAYALQFNYSAIVEVTYDTEDVSRKWEPAYCLKGQVIKLKLERTAKVPEITKIITMETPE